MAGVGIIEEEDVYVRDCATARETRGGYAGVHDVVGYIMAGHSMSSQRSCKQGVARARERVSRTARGAPRNARSWRARMDIGNRAADVTP